MTASSLTPMLTVKDARAAVGFYRDAFGAVELARFEAPTGHAVIELAIDGLRFYVVDENPDAFNVAPRSLGGTTVRTNLVVDDPDGAAARAIAAGRPRSSRSATSRTASVRAAWPIPTGTTG